MQPTIETGPLYGLRTALADDAFYGAESVGTSRIDGVLPYFYVAPVSVTAGGTEAPGGGIPGPVFNAELLDVGDADGLFDVDVSSGTGPPDVDAAISTFSTSWALPVSNPAPFDGMMPVGDANAGSSALPVSDPDPTGGRFPVSNPDPAAAAGDMPVSDPDPVDEAQPFEGSLPVSNPFPVSDSDAADVAFPVSDPFPVSDSVVSPIPHPIMDDDERAKQAPVDSVEDVVTEDVIVEDVVAPRPTSPSPDVRSWSEYSGWWESRADSVSEMAAQDSFQFWDGMTSTDTQANYAADTGGDNTAGGGDGISSGALADAAEMDGLPLLQALIAVDDIWL